MSIAPTEFSDQAPTDAGHQTATATDPRPDIEPTVPPAVEEKNVHPLLSPNETIQSLPGWEQVRALTDFSKEQLEAASEFMYASHIVTTYFP